MKEENKNKRKTKDEVKIKLVRSLVEGYVFENEVLNKRLDNVTNYEEVIPMVKEYGTIIRSKKKEILNVAY